MILLKWQYTEIWPFLKFDIYHFSLSLIHLFKKNETLEFWHNWFLALLNNWSRFLNWKDLGLSPSPPNCSKDSWNYCSCLYLSIGQVWWLNMLWFKRYNQKSTLSRVLVLIHEFTDLAINLWLKIQKLEYLENRT